MSDPVHVRYTKWDGSLHWHFDADRIAEDAAGTWVVAPPGSQYRRGTEPARIDEHGFILLLPRDQWFSAYFNAVPRGVDGNLVYVDINTAVRWEDNTAHLVDLDLDVTLDASGVVELLDEDEFAEHQVAFDYPADVIDRVRTTAAQVFASIEERREPFGREGFGKLAATLGWVHGSVVTGHGAASGRGNDPRFPDGTLSLQFPHFLDAGIDLRLFHHGTINVQSAFEMQPVRPAIRIEQLEWLAGYPRESFSFFDAKIAVAGRVHDALAYRPDPDTKPEFYQAPGTIELLAPFIPEIDERTAASVWIDPTQASFS